MTEALARLISVLVLGFAALFILTVLYGMKSYAERPNDPAQDYAEDLGFW